LEVEMDFLLLNKKIFIEKIAVPIPEVGFNGLSGDMENKYLYPSEMYAFPFAPEKALMFVVSFRILKCNRMLQRSACPGR